VAITSRHRLLTRGIIDGKHPEVLQCIRELVQGHRHHRRPCATERIGTKPWWTIDERTAQRWAPREPFADAEHSNATLLDLRFNTLIAGDVDGDGIIDVLFASERSLTVFFGDGHASWGRAATLEATPFSRRLRQIHLVSASTGGNHIVAEFADNECRSDGDCGLTAFRHTGDRRFDRHIVHVSRESDTHHRWPRVIMGNFLGSGRAEFVLRQPYLNRPRLLTLSEDLVWRTIDLPRFDLGNSDNIAAADMNGDGKDELIMSWMVFDAGCGY
jgi:hypothetical protein